MDSQCSPGSRRLTRCATVRFRHSFWWKKLSFDSCIYLKVLLLNTCKQHFQTRATQTGELSTGLALKLTIIPVMYKSGKYLFNEKRPWKGATLKSPEKFIITAVPFLSKYGNKGRRFLPFFCNLSEGCGRWARSTSQGRWEGVQSILRLRFP